MGLGSFLGKALGFAASPAVSLGAGLASGLFGSKSKGAQPATSQSQSGWGALPPALQNAYLNTFLPGALNYYNSSPNNPYQKQVQQAYGGGISGLMQQLPDYLQVFQQNVDNPTLAEMQRQAEIEKNKITAQAANSGLGSLLNSNLGVQLSELQSNADRRKMQYLYDTNRQNLNSALDLRNQTLGELTKAGDQDYNRLSKLGSLFGAFPGSSVSNSRGEAQAKPNTWDKIAGTTTALGALYDDYRDRPWAYGFF